MVHAATYPKRFGGTRSANPDDRCLTSKLHRRGTVVFGEFERTLQAVPFAKRVCGVEMKPSAAEIGRLGHPRSLIGNAHKSHSPRKLDTGPVPALFGSPRSASVLGGGKLHNVLNLFNVYEQGKDIAT